MSLINKIKDKIRTLEKSLHNCFLTSSLIECPYGF